MKRLDTRLLRLIKGSKGQFISLSIMIILSFTIYISFSMLADNLSDSIFHFYEVTNFGDIFIEAPRIPKTAIEGLYDIEGVGIAQGRISINVPLRVEDPDERVVVRLVSLPKGEDIVNDLYILEGSKIGENPKEVLVLKQFSDARGIEPGDGIRPYIKGREYSLDVTGTVGSPEYIYLMENEQDLLTNPEKFGIVYVSEEFAQHTLGYGGSYNEVVIQIKDDYKVNIDNIIDEIETQLDRYEVTSIIGRKDQISHNVMMQEVDQIDRMATSVSLLFLIVAGIIINIILSRIVKNDRISIGIMKALGYDNAKILFHYAKYSLLIGVVGSVAGVILSIPLSISMARLLIQYFNVPMFRMRLDYIYFIYGILFTVLFCVLSGLIGARNVTKILPAESMRPEAPKGGGRIWLEGVKPLWGRVPFSWKVVIRNALRSKRRSVFLILGIALSYSVTMVPMFMNSIWNNLFLLQYGEFQRMDYSVEFAVPMNPKVIKELNQLVDADQIEPKIELPFEIRNGWKKKTVSIIGVPRDTIFYNFKDLSRKEIELPEDGIFLSQILADSLGAEVGDEIMLKSLISEAEEYIIVKGIVEQYLGSNGYTDIEVMSGVLKEGPMITGALLKTQDDAVAKLKNIKNIRQVQSIQDMQESMQQYMDTIIAAVGIMIVLGAILAFAIVYNITIININERGMEFSSLRVLGFDKKEIYGLISRENGIMALIGIILGIPIGYGLCSGMASALSSDLFSIPFILGPSSYIIAGGATIVFVAIAQLATARKIYKLNFLDVLKNRMY